MVKPRDFMLISDFPNLKNDANNSPGTNLVIPASIVIASGGVYQQSVNLTIGTVGSVIRGRIAASQDSSGFYVGNDIGFPRSGTAGGAVNYIVYCFIFRTAPTTVTLQILIYNPYGVSLTTNTFPEQITFYFNTFLEPFV